MTQAKTRVVNLRENLYDIYIGRAGHGEGGYFGNPIRVGQPCGKCGNIHHDAGSTLLCYKRYFDARIENDPEFRTRILELQGKRLGCFCKPKPCHGDVIKEYLDSMPVAQKGPKIINEFCPCHERRRPFGEEDRCCQCGLLYKRSTDDDNEKNYKEFWRELLEPNGVLDKRQLMRELADYSMIMKYYGRVLDELTGGRICKVNTDPRVVIGICLEETEKTLEDHKAWLRKQIEDTSRATTCHEHQVAHNIYKKVLTDLEDRS